jgi:carbon-monoxide dehydrogenase medium subunit
MKRFEYYRPQTLDEAWELKDKFQDRAKYIAGGTDLIIRIKQKAVEPDALISLREIEALKGIESNASISLGSMTPIRDIERDADLRRDYPALVQAARCLANPQIRNVATVGGNLVNAAPSADCAPPLMILDAKLVLERPGQQREVAIEAFFEGPGLTCMEAPELLREISIPAPPQQSGMAFLKMGRVSQDIAKVSAAVLIVMDGNICRMCRICAGAVAPVPLRLKKVEAALEGEKITPGVLDDVAKTTEKEIRPITDVRSTQEYRRIASGVIVKRALKQALESTEKD